jgi:hypothetical protein
MGSYIVTYLKFSASTQDESIACLADDLSHCLIQQSENKIIHPRDWQPKAEYLRLLE